MYIGKEKLTMNNQESENQNQFDPWGQIIII